MLPSLAHERAPLVAPAPLTAKPAAVRLARTPYAGVRCPRGNSLACDRIGLAVWLVGRPSSLTATIAGHLVRMQPPPASRPALYWQGSLQPAGMLRPGPTHVIPDRGRFWWAGRHPRALWVGLTGRAGARQVLHVRLRIRLHPGWG